MLQWAIGGFLALHGLVHWLYFGQSRRFFELQPGMLWPDGAWSISRLLGNEATRWLAGAACVLAGLAAQVSCSGRNGGARRRRGRRSYRP
jgi:hypothetical protein